MGIKSIVKNMIPDKMYLSIQYKRIFGKNICWSNPKTYNEKLQWLKIYNRNPLYVKLVDKCEVKKYVSKIIGAQYIIPTLGVWNSVDEIDFNQLPEAFVLKCTHDSGGVYICKDKNNFSEPEMRKIIERSLKNNFYYFGREWPYKLVPPRIIAEPYLEDNTYRELRDYKFFVFDGYAKLLFIASDRQKAEETKFDFFDMNGDFLPFTNGHPNSKVPPLLPEKFDEMKFLAEKLGSDMPHVRVDFYEINGKIYFGEMTFFHWSGLVPFEPNEWDEIIGSWITLPIEKKRKK